VSILHAELSEDSGDIGFLTETDSGIIAVDFDAEELTCWAKVRDFVLL